MYLEQTQTKDSDSKVTKKSGFQDWSSLNRSLKGLHIIYASFEKNWFKTLD